MAKTVELINRDELITLVPHKGRMFLLSRVVSYDLENHSLSSEYDITGDCLFYREDLGGVPSWAGFEFMAQSISALSGLRNRGSGKKPPFGFILSVSDMVLHIPVLKEGTTAFIEVEEETVVDSVYSFRCSLFSGPSSAAERTGDKKIKAAGAKLTVMETEDISRVVY
jgi:predicted hotdog family 3-hydroxylacyl-ACP dehydratase